MSIIFGSPEAKAIRQADRLLNIQPDLNGTETQQLKAELDALKAEIADLELQLADRENDAAHIRALLTQSRGRFSPPYFAVPPPPVPHDGE